MGGIWQETIQLTLEISTESVVDGKLVRGNIEAEAKRVLLSTQLYRGVLAKSPSLIVYKIKVL